MMCSIGKRLAQTCAESAIFCLGVQGTKSEVQKIRKGELFACAFEFTPPGDRTVSCDTKLLIHGFCCPCVARVSTRSHGDDDVLTLLAIRLGHAQEHLVFVNPELR
jgi:hypothetical protein